MNRSASMTGYRLTKVHICAKFARLSDKMDNIVISQLKERRGSHGAHHHCDFLE